VPSLDPQPLRVPLAPQIFGAGGAHLAQAGVALEVEMTSHAVVGLIDVIRGYAKFRRLFHQLVRLAARRTPDLIILVDFGAFNRRFAHAIRQCERSQRGRFANWRPKIVQYVSPQVWASRPGRAKQLARDLDLLLSIFPFEKAWYTRHTPNLAVEFVGNPILDRYREFAKRRENESDPPEVLLLPGSRESELRRHLPVMLHAAGMIRATQPVTLNMVLPTERLLRQALAYPKLTPGLKIQCGNLPEALTQATVAIASTGTVTMECAYFGVPTVALYVASWPEYQIGKRLIRVQHLAMPNILAGEPILPEFIQSQATPENISRAALEFIRDPNRRVSIRKKLANVIRSLGPSGANERAAAAIVRLLQ
jgi:lipid-A-disaccharide synthase